MKGRFVNIVVYRVWLKSLPLWHLKVLDGYYDLNITFKYKLL